MPDLSAPTPRRPTLPSRSTVAGMVIATLAGCTGGLNRSVGPLGTTVPDLEPQSVMPESGSSLVREEAWSYGTVDRSSWEVVVIAAPRGQVETNPAPDFTPAVMVGRDARSDAMPTAETAVVVVSNDGRVALDGLADPFRAAWSLIESPFGLVVRPPWSTVVGPTPRAYEVLPHTVAPTTASAVPESTVVE